MGEPIKTADLAREIILLSGVTVQDEENPEGEIEIRFTGLRPGEKLYEELITGDNWKPTRHPRILIADDLYLKWEKLEQLFDDLFCICDTNDYKALQ